MNPSDFSFVITFTASILVIRLIVMWYKNIEDGQLNGFVLINFRKAFDMINIDLLLSKPKLY